MQLLRRTFTGLMLVWVLCAPSALRASPAAASDPDVDFWTHCFYAGVYAINHTKWDVVYCWNDYTGDIGVYYFPTE
jgi:hypothetical protein